jgi:hypothetical protein
MRQAARLLARIAQASPPVREAPVAPRTVSPDAAALEELLTRTDAQIATMDELIRTTQVQVRSLIALKVSAVGDSESMRELASAQVRLSELSTELGAQSENTREAAAYVQRSFGLPGSPLTLSELVTSLPASQRRPLEERVSAMRSMGQALQELQRVAQIHAHRGLQAVAAWRTVLGVPQSEAGATYSRTGRPTMRPTTPATSVDLDL